MRKILTALSVTCSSTPTATGNCWTAFTSRLASSLRAGAGASMSCLGLRQSGLTTFAAAAEPLEARSRPRISLHGTLCPRMLVSTVFADRVLARGTSEFSSNVIITESGTCFASVADVAQTDLFSRSLRRLEGCFALRVPFAVPVAIHPRRRMFGYGLLGARVLVAAFAAPREGAPGAEVSDIARSFFSVKVFLGLLCLADFTCLQLITLVLLCAAVAAPYRQLPAMFHLPGLVGGPHLAARARREAAGHASVLRSCLLVGICVPVEMTRRRLRTQLLGMFWRLLVHAFSDRLITCVARPGLELPLLLRAAVHVGSTLLFSTVAAWREFAGSAVIRALCV